MSVLWPQRGIYLYLHSCLKVSVQIQIKSPEISTSEKDCCNTDSLLWFILTFPNHVLLPSCMHNSFTFLMSCDFYEICFIFGGDFSLSLYLSMKNCGNGGNTTPSPPEDWNLFRLFIMLCAMDILERNSFSRSPTEVGLPIFHVVILNQILHSLIETAQNRIHLKILIILNPRGNKNFRCVSFSL